MPSVSAAKIPVAAGKDFLQVFRRLRIQSLQCCRLPYIFRGLQKTFVRKGMNILSSGARTFFLDDFSLWSQGEVLLWKRHRAA